MLEYVIVGLVSGLVVSFVVLVLSKFWKNVVEPIFEEKVYKGLHIEGKWYSLYVEATDFRQETIKLKRRGHTITGHMVCKTGADEGEEYSITGSFRNLLLPLTYETTDKKKSDRGTVTLMSTHNGERLVGKVTLYETNLDTVVTAQVIWFRNKDDLNDIVEYIKRHREQLKDIRKKEEAIKKEFNDFFLDFPKEYAEIKEAEQNQKSKQNIIEGESKRIDNSEKDSFNS
ncbi:hypothetical protein CBF23_012775 [Marinomonas agarivorans]|nr:hypothetical protein CBF23_012775 [Marinomonas agarivorans]